MPVAKPAVGLQNICISSHCPHFAFSSFGLSCLQGFSFSLFLPLAGCAARGGHWQARSWHVGSRRARQEPWACPLHRPQDQTHRPWHWGRALSEGAELSSYACRDHREDCWMHSEPKPMPGDTCLHLHSYLLPSISPHCSASLSIPEVQGTMGQCPLFTVQLGHIPISRGSPLPQIHPGKGRPLHSKGSTMKTIWLERDPTATACP